jgi:HlyD family secretion protein
VTAAERQVAAAKGSLAQAQTSQLNPDIQFVQLARLQTQRAQAAAQLSAAQAEVRRVQAVQAEIMAQLQDLVLVSPIDGVVVTSTAEPGEVIAAGTPVITLVNLNRVYLRGYVSEGDLGRVRVGQAARVFLDSAPEQPLAATVTAIDTEASFTPENIYFRDDRVTQVFGVKLNLINPDGFAKPGMPADGEILWETP